MYQIRKAQPGDLPRILDIYACARDFMVRTGNPHQWGTTNPSREQLEQDMAEGKLFAVCREEDIHGVFFFAIG